MTAYNKLVRDNVPEILSAKGVAYEMRIAGAEEYKAELIKKLQEEAGEFAEAGDPEELADVLEVIAALTKLPEYRNAELLRVQKREERGGFDEKIIVKGEK